MSLIHSPSISTNGLVLALDAVNPKSYDSRENLLQYSQALATSPWNTIVNTVPGGAGGTGGFIVTNNVTTSPDGGVNASQMNSTSWVGGDSVFQDSSVSGSGTYTLSIFVKGGTCNSITFAAFFIGNSTQGFSFNYNPLTAQITGGSGTVVSYPNDWYRIYFTVTGTNALNTTLRFQVYTNTTGITYLWGAQLEKGPGPTNYTATTNSTISRPTVWTDLSGNGYNFNINSSAYSISGGIPHMNFEGSYGAAKRVVGGSLTDVPNFSNGTIMCFSTILNSNATWRTLTRGSSVDHQVIIQETTDNLGMYDNEAGGFIDSTFDITSLPNPYTQFNCLTFRLSQYSPYYQFQYNDNSTVYSITNSNATFNNGFSVIGAYHANTTGTGSGDSSQYWGKISAFLYYKRHLTESEIQQNFNALRRRYGI